MESAYDPSIVEPKWQKRWEEAHGYDIDIRKAKNPLYALVMFPYPSGARLHVGHWYQYGPTDSFVRFLRMRGHDVFFPMGFDAFGLPAENYAIKTGVFPARSTAENIMNMKEQFRHMGCMVDWRYEVNTSDPTYYRWTQWLFLQMFTRGFAYRKEANVNFCPSCQTVLAREQCQDGHCERCETQVLQKPLTQWFWKITDYAQRLLDGLEDLDWPERTKTMQRNWIGRSDGAAIEFKIKNEKLKIEVFTTRPDTLFGATYLVLAPEHPLVATITPKNHIGAVSAYLEDVRKKTELERTDLAKEKTGVWTGAYAVNPATEEEIPIWIADYVLVSYGTGAVMAVPAHDERDWAFAKRYDLPLREVVSPFDRAQGDTSKGAFTGDGVNVNSSFLDGLTTSDAKKKVVSWLEDKECGRHQTTWRLKDWLVSRQRYWGAPVPIVYDPEGSPHPVPEKNLPWLLPTDVEFKPTGESPLKGSKELKDRVEKMFGKGWEPEYDTMDTFVCSSFYYLRFLAACHPELVEGRHAQHVMVRRAHHDVLIDPEIERKWMPVSVYMGGAEHACMHLIYARFVMMALKDFGFVSNEEPFKKLVHQGLITNQGAKMSKSKGNVVDPDPFVTKYGSDVFRMTLMFMGPYVQGGDWNDTGIKGIERFVQRIWRLFEANEKCKMKNVKLDYMMHRTVKRVTEDLENFHFNTVISALMECLNVLEEQEHVSEATLKTFALLLAPIAPHLAEELWEKIGGSGFVMEQPWPTYDPRYLESDTVTIVVQVNGKVRANIEVAAGSSKDDVLSKAMAQENVQKFLGGRAPTKEIYIEGKLVNIVL